MRTKLAAGKCLSALPPSAAATPGERKEHERLTSSPGERKQHEDGSGQHLHTQQPALQVDAVLGCRAQQGGWRASGWVAAAGAAGAEAAAAAETAAAAARTTEAAAAAAGGTKAAAAAATAEAVRHALVGMAPAPVAMEMNSPCQYDRKMTALTSANLSSGLKGASSSWVPCSTEGVQPK